MKKIEFYTLRCVDGVKRAEKKTGWTDGTFNYYKTDDGYWFAIHPLFGLATGSAQTTRKAAASQAHSPQIMEKINNLIHSDVSNEWHFNFKNMIREAQEATI